MDMLSFLGLAFALCLAISALGFSRVDWFVSLGYGFSIAAQAILFGALFVVGLSLWTGLQLALLLAYGMRLGLYLVARERSPSFARELEASKERGRHIKGWLKLTIWVSVAALYVAMFSPALFTLVQASAGGSVGSVLPGLVVAALGLGTESLADEQKARFKATNPKKFTQGGLYGVVRYPNYFGEMVFWLGIWISGLSAYAGPLEWLLSLAGLVCIQLIMIGSTRRLEFKQAERYGADPAYLAYTRSVPVLFPLVPLYSVKGARIYLG